VDRSGHIRLVRMPWGWLRRCDGGFCYRKNFRSLKTLLEGTILLPEAFHLGTEKLDFVGMHCHYNSVQSESM